MRWLARIVGMVLVLLVCAATALALEPGAEITLAASVTVANSDTAIPGRPAVASDGSNYLVVSCRQVGTPSELFGVMVSPSGIVVRTFPISPGACPTGSALAFDGTNYLLVFARDGQVSGTRISTQGTVLDGASGFPISSGAPLVVTNWFPAVAFDGVNHLVVWSKFNGTYDIYGARVTPGGQVLGEFPVFTAPGEQIMPAITFDGTRYFVVWRSGSGPSADTDLVGARVTTGGTVLDPVGITISTAPGVQDAPAVASGGGNYLVVWRDTRPDVQSSGHIVAARVTSNGALLDGPPDTGGIPIHAAAAEMASPTVTFDGTHFVVAWQVGAYRNTPPAGIFARRVSVLAQLLDGPVDTGAIQVSTPACDACRLVNPSLASNGVTSFLAWVNNTELAGSTKDVVGTSFCEAVELGDPSHPCFGISAAEFFPIAPGTVWTYRENDGSTSTRTALAQPVDVNGVATTVIRDDSDGAEEFYTNDGEGLHLHRLFAPGTFIDGVGAVDLTLTFAPPIQVLRAATRFGSTVHSTVTATASPLPGTAPYTATFALRGPDTVTVPAGTFDVARLEASLDSSAMLTLDLASGIGVVRAVTTAPPTASELIAVGPDATPPTITVATVIPTGPTTATSLALTGGTTDNFRVTSVSWSNDRGGSGLASGTRTWSTGPIALAPGINRITLTARDLSGNVRTSTVRVVSFADELVPHVTAIRAAHFLDLAQAIGHLRTSRGLSSHAWTGGAPAPGGVVRASHLNDLRVSLAGYCDVATCPPFARTAIAPGSVVSAAHLRALRELIASLP